MNRIFILTLCLLFGFSAQKVSAQTHHFQLETFANYSATRYFNDGSVPDNVEESYNDISRWKPSCSVTGKYNFILTDNSEFSVGLGYQNFGERTAKLLLNFGGPTDSLVAVRFRYVNHYVEIPLGVKYYFGDRLYASSSFSFLVNASNRMIEKKYFDDGNTTLLRTNDQSFDPHKLICQLGVGLGWNFYQNTKFNLYVQPTIQMTLTAIAKDASLNRKMVGMGAVFGISF